MVRKGPRGQVGHLRKEEKDGRGDEFHGAECRNGSAETHLAPKADRLLRLGVPRDGVARRRRLLSERASAQRRGDDGRLKRQGCQRHGGGHAWKKECWA